MTEFEKAIIDKMSESTYCPLCNLLDKKEFDMLCSLQFDVSHDPATRDSVAAEGGFCDFHFRQFYRLANAKTNALLLAALVGLYAGRQNHIVIRCRICAVMNDYEHQLLEAVMNLFNDGSFRKGYTNHSGMCWEHLDAVRRTHPELNEWFDAAQQEQLQREIPLLEQIVTKSYYETSHRARSAVTRTIEKFVGRKAISR